MLPEIADGPPLMAVKKRWKYHMGFLGGKKAALDLVL
jgi:hypothetical protein